jgi:hypothetical protein
MGLSPSHDFDDLRRRDARLQERSVRAHQDDDEITDTTELAESDSLVINLLPNSTYNFTFNIYVDSAGAAEGFQAALGGTAGVANLIADIELTDLVTGSLAALSRIDSFDSAVGAVLSIGASLMRIVGTIETSTAGTMLLQYAQADGLGLADTTILRGSNLIAEKL